MRCAVTAACELGLRRKISALPERRGEHHKVVYIFQAAGTSAHDRVAPPPARLSKSIGNAFAVSAVVVVVVVIESRSTAAAPA